MSNDSVSNNLASFDELYNSGDFAKKEQKLASPGRSKTAAAKNLPLATRVVSMQVPIVPPNIATPNIATISDMFSELRDQGKVDAIGALPRDKLDDRVVSNKAKGTATFTTNKMDFFGCIGKDGDFMALVRSMVVAKYDESELIEFLDALDETMNIMGSAGTMIGLITRLKTGMLSTPNIRLDKKQCVKWANSMVTYHKTDFEYRNKAVTEVIRVLFDEGKITFNKSSSAGIPWNKSTGSPGVFKTALSLSDSILDAIATGRYGEMIGKERKALLGVMLKNKQDYYNIEQLQTKVRPYFVYGLHERFMYTALQANLKAVRFDEHDDVPAKGSAVGFSWNYGGGDSIYDWITRSNTPGSFKAIFYGDDQLWVVTLMNGEIYVLTPDFSHMDLSLVSDWAVVSYDVWKPAFTKLDKTWTAVLKMNCKRAYIKPVVVEGPLTYQFKQGMGSGIPGTTKFDEVASAAVCGFVKEKFEEHVSGLTGKVDLHNFLLYIADEVHKTFGLTFKQDTLSTYYFEPNQPVYNFVFLGQTLKRVYGKARPHYIPVPQLKKLVVSASTYKKRYKSAVIKQRATMEKLRSLYAGGAMHYPVLADRLLAYYQLLEKRNYTPLTSDDPDEYVAETESSIFMDIVFPEGDMSWPTHEWCMNLYLPVDDQLDEYSGLSKSELESNPADTHAAEIDIGLDEFDTTESDEESSEESEHHEEVVSDVPTEVQPRVTPWQPPSSSSSVERKSKGKEPAGWQPPPAAVVYEVKQAGATETDPMVEIVSKALEYSWGQAADEERRTRPSGAVFDVGIADVPILPAVKSEAEMYLIQSKWTPEQKAEFRANQIAERNRAKAEKQALIEAQKSRALGGTFKGGKPKKRGQSHKGQSIRELLFEGSDVEDDYGQFSE